MDWSNHGLRTPNEGINQRNLKIWADVSDKICFSRTLKFGTGFEYSALQWSLYPLWAMIKTIHLGFKAGNVLPISTKLMVSLEMRMMLAIYLWSSIYLLISRFDLALYLNFIPKTFLFICVNQPVEFESNTALWAWV